MTEEPLMEHKPYVLPSNRPLRLRIGDFKIVVTREPSSVHVMVHYPQGRGGDIGLAKSTEE